MGFLLTPGDLATIDESTTFIIRPSDLEAVPALSFLGEPVRAELRDVAEGVVQSILNFPSDLSGHRYIARAEFRESLELERDMRVVRLGRSPATVVSVALDGENLPLDEVVERRAMGVIAWRAGFWPAHAELVVEYYGGWRTPAQVAGGVGDLAAEGETAPLLPAEIKHACLRAAQVAWSGYGRADVGARSWREVDSDVGEFNVTYAAPPTEGGVDAELFRLLAPWRRLGVY